MAAGFTLQDYAFAAPPQWLRNDLADHIELRSPDSGCLIMLLEPQPGSGDLDAAAASAFSLMYPPATWQQRNAGKKAFTLVRGQTAQKLPYSMVDAEMSMESAAGFHPERGVAVAIQAADAVAIIAARHSDFSIAHGNCYGKYDYWPRFFDSFEIATIGSNVAADSTPETRLIGAWRSEDGGPAMRDYVFRDDGIYLAGGGVGTTSVSMDDRYEYITHTSYSSDGDGKFSIDGEKLTLRPHGGDAEEARVRLVEVNDGGEGWRDQLRLLKSDAAGPYEARFERAPVTP